MWGERLVLAERLERVCRGLDLEPLVAEELRESGACVHFIIDNQNPT
jgi:hypothetical protein